MSTKLIDKIEKMANQSSHLVVKRKLKILIELELPSGATVTIKDHPARVHFEVWNGQYKFMIPNCDGQWEYADTRKKVPANALYIQKYLRTFLHEQVIDTMYVDNNLLIINDWIALKVE